METKTALNDGSIAITLAQLLPTIRQLSAMDKIKLIRILAEDLDIIENKFLFEPNKTYDLPTPYHAFGAAEILMDLLKSAEEEASS